MHADIAGAGKQKDSFVRFHLPEGFSGGSCHIEAVEVVYLVVADFFAFVFMIKTLVIALIVAKRSDQALELEEGFDVQIASFKLIQRVEDLLQMVFRIKNSGFIHIIPEAVDSLIQQDLIFVSEPFARLRL